MTDLDLFTDDDVVSTYSDAEAVGDGMLVDLGGGHRTTHLVHTFLTAKLPKGSGPPTDWPVEMMGWFASKDPERRAVAAARGLVDVHERKARAAWDDAGIFKAWPILGSHGEELVALTTEKPAGDDAPVFWLIPNEVGGITLMFPSDY